MALRSQTLWLVNEQGHREELETVIRDLWDLRIRGFDSSQAGDATVNHDHSNVEKLEHWDTSSNPQQDATPSEPISMANTRRDGRGIKRGEMNTDDCECFIFKRCIFHLSNSGSQPVSCAAIKVVATDLAHEQPPRCGHSRPTCNSVYLLFLPGPATSLEYRGTGLGFPDSNIENVQRKDGDERVVSRAAHVSIAAYYKGGLRTLDVGNLHAGIL